MVVVGIGQDRDWTLFPPYSSVTIKVREKSAHKCKPCTLPYYTRVHTGAARARQLSCFLQEFLFSLRSPLFIIFLPSRFIGSKHMGAACVRIRKKGSCLWLLTKTLFKAVDYIIALLVLCMCVRKMTSMNFWFGLAVTHIVGQ